MKSFSSAARELGVSRSASGFERSEAASVRHFEVTVAQPAAGTAKERSLPPAETIAVLAAPELYSTVTMRPSGFLNAKASPPLVATTLAPGSTYCAKWRENVVGGRDGQFGSVDHEQRVLRPITRRVVALAHRIQHHVPGAVRGHAGSDPVL